MNIQIPVAWLALLAGLAVGSFLNVCIHRIPRRLSVIRPPSACPACGSRIRWYDNIPPISFIFLRGRCRSCGERISWQYPAVELATGLLFAAAASQGIPIESLLFHCAWISLLIVVTIVDLRHQIIPDVITLPGIVLALASRFVTQNSVLDGVLGLLTGAGSLLLIAWIYRRATGVDGLGGGDIKLMGMVGAYLGWQNALLVIFIASAAGSIIGLVQMLRGRAGRRTPLPFGSLLGPTAVLLLLEGSRLPVPFGL